MDLSAKVEVRSRRIDGLLQNFKPKSSEAVHEAVRLIGEYADPETPVLTGALLHSREEVWSDNGMRGGQKWTATNKQGEPYGRFVNDGTIHMAARPFATNAQAKAAKWLKARMKAIVQGEG